MTKSAELDRAMPNVLGSVYGNTDQRCLANEVVIDVGDVNDELQECLIEGAEEMTVGVGLNEGTDVGPVITSDARDRISDLVDGAVEEGTELVLDRCDFEHPEHPDGNFVTGDMTIAQEEIFGPVLCLASGDGLDEAIEMVNGTRYGNASSIYTERGGEARRYRYKVDADNIGINVGVCA